MLAVQDEEKKKRGNKKKIQEKEENLSKLEKILEALKKSGQAFDKTDLAKLLGVTRQTLYQKHYQELFRKHEIGHEFEEKKKASPDYLNERIKKKEIEIERLNKKIENLKIQIHDLELYNQSISQERNSLQRILNTFRFKFYDQIIMFNNMNRFTVPFETFDIFDLSSEDHKVISDNYSVNAKEKESNVVNLSDKSR